MLHGAEPQWREREKAEAEVKVQKVGKKLFHAADAREWFPEIKRKKLPDGYLTLTHILEGF